MTRINRKFTYSIVAMVIALAISSPAVTAQNGDEPERSLAGVWQSRILPHNCTTGVPIPTAAFESLFTFNSDGTMSAWVQNAVVTVTRGPAHGLWRRDRGWSEYSFKIVHMRYNLTTGAFNGKQESGGTLALSDTGDEFTTEGWTQQFDAAGNPSPQQGCSTSVGTRFKLDE
jgi:hypothetical protein